MDKFYALNAVGENRAELLIFDQIGQDVWGDGISQLQFMEELAALGDVNEIDVRISSPGGLVMVGVAMYNALMAHPATITVHVDSAWSMASYLAMSASPGRLFMAENGLMMIHNPTLESLGRVDVDDLESARQMLEASTNQMVRVYAARTGQEPDAIRAMMKATTWLEAAEAKELGFVDEITGAAKMAASYAVPQSVEVPDKFSHFVKREEPKMAEATATKTETPKGPTAATLQELKASLKGADSDFILAQMEGNATLAQAQSAWTEELSKRLDAETQEKTAATAKVAELEKANAELNQAPEPGKKGPVGTRNVGESVPEARTRWLEAIAAEEKLGHSRAEATVRANRKNPGLRQEMQEALGESF